MTSTDKTRYVFWVCLLAAISLLTTSFILPPTGVIDSSVLAGVGELFGFSALYEFVSLARQGKAASIIHNNTTLKIEGDKPVEAN